MKRIEAPQSHRPQRSGFGEHCFIERKQRQTLQEHACVIGVTLSIPGTSANCLNGE